MKLGPRLFLVPEVLQASSMDCGPAALKAVLAGHGIHVDYDELRARCQTDVDGTSLDALAALASELGLRADRVLLPRDHFCLPAARCLPAIVVTRSSGGLLHFIVVWRSLGPFVQVLDPGSGRRWIRREALLRVLPEFPMRLSSSRFRAWACSENASRAWRARLSALGVRGARARGLLERAAADPSFCSFARLDAALRFIAALVDGRAVPRGRVAARLLDAVSRPPSGEGPGEEPIPPRFFWASDRGVPDGQLSLRGCVILQLSPAASARRAAGGAAARRSRLEPDGAKARLERGPLRELWDRADADARWLGVAAALLVPAALVPLEALVLRALLGLSLELGLDYQRLALGAVVATLFGLGLCLETKTTAALRRLGRSLAARLHVELLAALPRLPEAFLLSRPSSDMMARGHTLHLLRDLPNTWGRGARALSGLVATSGGLVWLDLQAAPVTLGLIVIALLVPRLCQRVLVEASVRLRVHTTALDRLRLDALLGASPVRVHAAEASIAAEHEERLCEWSRTATTSNDAQVLVVGVQALSSAALVTLLVVGYVTRGGDAALLPLLVYWALRVPQSAIELVTVEQALRSQRAVLTRLLAPIAAQSREHEHEHERVVSTSSGGVELRFEGVSVEAGGHRVLDTLDLTLAGGRHVAIVGTSGAGKSSLLGLLLGWLRPATGTVRVDGRDLWATGALRALRDQSAWVDPATQIWARSIYDNVTFGDPLDVDARLPVALERADLLEVLEGLPEGLSSAAGEAGSRLSGGQGQRLRLGRAMMRPDARLVLLDEPFRGLERERRRLLLERVHAHWPRATLLLVSHDIEDTLDFERVLVLDGGRLVEDGAPAQLLERAGSRYAALLAAARELGGVFSAERGWRRCSLADGHLRADGHLQATPEAPRP